VTQLRRRENIKQQLPRLSQQGRNSKWGLSVFSKLFKTKSELKKFKTQLVKPMKHEPEQEYLLEKLV
jgi:hypothetical protein